MSYCTPCPPCDTNFPLLCEPLETTANGKRLVVEDSAACQKTIQSPVAQQILKTDGAGNLTWTNGVNSTVLGKDSTGKVEFATLNSVLQSGPVDLGIQPLTTTGAINSGSLNSSGDITTFGNVGIGTNSPTNKLVVVGGIDTQHINVANTTGAAYIEVGGTNAYIDLKVPNSDDLDLRVGTSGNGGYLSTSGNSDITLSPGGTGAVSITGTTFGVIEMSGPSGAYIDLKSPSTDDLDFRVGTGGDGGYLSTSGTGTSNITIAPGGTSNVLITNLKTYANNAAAVTGGLAVNTVYKTATGELRVVV